MPGSRWTRPRDSQSEDIDLSSVKITLPQSKSLQPVAKARQSTACPSVKPSLDTALQQWIFTSLKRFITVRKLTGMLAAALIWFINSANSLILVPCRTMRAPCKIVPLTLPIILKFMSPSLRCPQWDMTPSTCLQSWKTIFNKSDNTLSQISPVRHDITEWMPTYLVKSLTTNHKLIKGNRSHIQGGREISAILLTVVRHCWKDQHMYGV